MTDAFRPEDLLEHGERVRALARRLVRDDATADDVVQDAWTAAVERPPRSGAPLGAWLVRVVRNLAARTHRDRARRERREERAAQPETTPAAEHVAAELEAHRRLVAALARLPDPYRTAVTLRFLDGLTPREIAARMEAPAATVGTWVHRGLARLRDELADDRTALAVLLLPLTGRGAPPAAPPPVVPVVPATLATGAAVSTQKLLLVAALLIAVVGGAVGVSTWLSDSNDTRSSPAATVAPHDDGARRHALVAEVDAPAPPPAATDDLPPPVDLAACDRDRDLFGRVVDEDGGAVALATIKTEWNPWRGIGLAGREQAEERTAGPATRSARDGSFALHLARGQCVDLRVEAAGFATSFVALCQAGERFDVVLRRGVELDVTVADEDGAPVVGAEVRIGGGGNLVGQPLDPYEQHLTALTDAAGVAHAALSPGYVTVGVLHRPSARAVWRSLQVPAEGSVALDLVLAAGRTLTGVITDRTTGAPLADARVEAHGAPGLYVRADDEGRYVLPGVPDLRAGIRVAAGGYETVLAPIGDGLVVDAALLPGDRMVARLLLADGTPATGALVFVRAPFDKTRAPLQLAGAAGPDGRVALAGLRHGVPHTLLASAPGAGRTVVDFDTPPDPRGTVDLGDVVLAPARRIEGIACDSAGHVLRNVSVTLLGCSDGRGRLRPAAPALSYAIVERRRTDDLGRFRFTDVAPGAYRLKLSAQDVPDAQLVDVVVPADRDLLDVRVSAPGDRSVTLRLTDVDGNPLAGLSVQAVGNFGWVEGHGQFLSLATDAAGCVTFRGLPAGDTSFSCATMTATPWVLTHVGPVVPDGQTLDVVIPRAAEITGEARDADGATLARMAIEARDGPTDDAVAYAETDDDGRFTLKVPEGARLDVVLTGRHTVSRGDGAMGTEQTPWHGEVSGIEAPATGIVIRATDSPPERDRTLAVVVRYSSGAPAVGVHVDVHSDAGVGSREATDGAGVARLDRLAAESARVSVWCGHLADAVPVGDVPPLPVDVVPNGQQIELVFEHGPEIRGRVVDAAGDPAPRGFVELMTHDYRYVTARIGDDGRFVVGALPERAHRLSARVYTSGGELTGVVEGVVPGGDDVTIVVRPKAD